LSARLSLSPSACSKLPNNQLGQPGRFRHGFDLELISQNLAAGFILSQLPLAPFEPAGASAADEPFPTATATNRPQPLASLPSFRQRSVRKDNRTTSRRLLRSMSIHSSNSGAGAYTSRPEIFLV
jgi:hypothetical protein